VWKRLFFDKIGDYHVVEVTVNSLQADERRGAPKAERPTAARA
jgi:hypothetical protein